MTPLERAARALFWSRGGGNWSQASQIEKDGWIKSARSMIEEIREPSELQTHTVSRILQKRGEYSYQSSAWVWKTMIDALID